MSQLGDPCKYCRAPVDMPKGRVCRDCFNSARRVGGSYPLPATITAPYDCTCGDFECFTCGDRMLQKLLDKRPATVPEPRSHVGIALSEAV
jgi:hypothetical protein